MSGHSKWAQIKRDKGVNDKKRAAIFSKLLKAISVAAKKEPDPKFNPRLRTAVLKAKENNVPQDNIDRAINKAAESAENLEELVIEAYGPAGVAILIEAATDNRNRTVAEIKKILGDFHGKWAEAGSVRWIFEPITASADRDQDSLESSRWRVKFTQPVSGEQKDNLRNLIANLEELDDVQEISTNAENLN